MFFIGRLSCLSNQVEGRIEEILKKVPSLFLVLSDNKTSVEIGEIIENLEDISSILRKSLSICVKDGLFIVDCGFLQSFRDGTCFYC